MIYIYDIIVNFNDVLLNFYEWDETDILEHIKKTLLFKVDNNFYNKIISSSIIVDEEFLSIIKNKTEIYSNKKLEKIEYACIFTSGTDALIVIFNEAGKIIEKSKFLIEEELEILEISNNTNIKSIKYKDTKNNYKIEMFRREEKKIINLILKELNLIKKDNEKLEYLYYEWFDKKCKTRNAYLELVKSISSIFTEKHYEFLNILKLMSAIK